MHTDDPKSPHKPKHTPQEQEQLKKIEAMLEAKDDLDEDDVKMLTDFFTK